MLDMWTDVRVAQIAQYYQNEHGNILLLAHITKGEYVACFITLLLQKLKPYQINM